MARAKPSKSSGHGVKVDTIWYDIEQLTGVDVDEDGNDRRRVVNRKVQIDVYLNKQFATTEGVPAPAATVGLGLTMVCDETGDVSRGFDSREVIKDLRAKLDHRFAIKWENWYYVKIDRARIYQGMGTGLEFSYDTIERGVALDGSVLMRRYNRSHGPHQSAWIVEPWPKQVKDNGRVVATIVASAENTSKLETFQSKIDELRKFLAELVTPERLEQTLMAAASDQFLALSHEDDERADDAVEEGGILTIDG